MPMGPRRNDPVDLAGHASRLRFPGDAEKAFRRYHSRNSVVIVRAALVLTVLLYGLFGILDVYAAPLSKHAIWFIRFAVVIPVLAGVLAFSFHRVFPRVLQPAMVFVVLTAGAGILAMIVIESHGELGYHTYYAGLMLVIMAAHSMYRLRFVHATLSSALIVVAYELIAVFHQKLFDSGEGFTVFLSNNFFFVSSMILGMAASYFLEVQTRRVFAQRIRLAQEQEKSDRLLLNILPRETAAALKEREGVIADHYDDASILFADVADFTPMAAGMKPNEIVELLDEVFSHFDTLVDRYGLEKIKTVGDCYMVAAGVPRHRPDHAHVLVRMGLDILSHAGGRSFGNGRRVSFRIGINSGPVVAGVIGRKKFIYDLWGDTVNVASRMECHGVSGTIQIATGTYAQIKDDFECEPRGTILVKGKGEMPVWHVVSEKKGVPADVDAPKPLST
jgi:adenylate cyclase